MAPNTKTITADAPSARPDIVGAEFVWATLESFDPRVGHALNVLRAAGHVGLRNLHMLRAAGRVSRMVRQRQGIAAALYAYADLTAGEIGTILNRDRTTIIYALRVVQSDPKSAAHARFRAILLALDVVARHHHEPRELPAPGAASHSALEARDRALLAQYQEFVVAMCLGGAFRRFQESGG